MEQKSHRPPTERGIPDSTTGLRPLIHRFALKMEEKLQRDDLRKGHWKKEGVSVLWACLLQEVKELEDALMSDATAEEITLECADVANLAMMVADMVGGFHDAVNALARAAQADSECCGALAARREESPRPGDDDGGGENGDGDACGYGRFG